MKNFNIVQLILYNQHIKQIITDFMLTYQFINY